MNKKILFLSGRELSYQRNQVILHAFQKLGFELDIISPQRKPSSLILASIYILVRAFWNLTRKEYVFIYSGFYGHLITIGLRTFTKKPILFDVFISSYDTLIHDRKEFSTTSPFAKLAYWIDKQSCAFSQHILIDTDLHAQYFTETFGIEKEKISAIPVGCSEKIFFNDPTMAKDSKICKVVYYCTFLPLHGVDVVIQAAAQLKNHPQIQFEIIGDGPKLKESQLLARELGLENLVFSKLIPIEEIPGKIRQATIALGGHWGPSEKASRVVPGKVYQLLASGKAILVGDTPANRNLLGSQGALYSPPGDSDHLAKNILKLANNKSLQEELQKEALAIYRQTCSESAITASLLTILKTKHYI